MGHIRMALLGTPDIRHGGAPITLPTRKALALLVYLAIEGGVHGRDKLADLLWPDSPRVEQSRATLRYTLSCLRAALHHDCASSSHLIEGKALGFDSMSDEWDLDLRSFQELGGPQQPDETRRALVARLDQACRLWRGDFLEGFSLRDAPDFDAWVRHHSEGWHRRMLSMLDRLSQAQADEGLVVEARDTTDRWLALSPLDERAYQRQIELALAVGDRPSARHSYQMCREILQRELGVAPSHETEAVAEQIHTELSVHVGQNLDRASELRATTLPHLPLVGREPELAQLAEAYHIASGGRANAALVQGEAGVGKTRLATEFLSWAVAQGADVLAGRAFETGGRVPYQPLVDGLRPRLERENAPDDLLSDVWLSELARLLPELADRYPDLQIPVGDEALARVRLYEAVARLGQALAGLSSGPLVLFLDDLQWADSATLDVLRYATRRWAELDVKVLLILNVRAEALAADAAIVDWLVGLERDLPITRVVLDSLNAGDTQVLVEAVGIEVTEIAESIVSGSSAESAPVADFAHWLFRETGGQPFFVSETLKALLERGALRPRRRNSGAWAFEVHSGLLHKVTQPGFVPPGVRDVLRARIARLDPAANALVAAASVIGQGCSFELLKQVAELGDREALQALDQAMHGSLLRETSGTYQFAHDKIREVAYAEAGNARRRVLHRRALQVLKRETFSAAELAQHALAAGLDDDAFGLSVAAGDAALRLLAARDAVGHYTRARTIAERHDWPDQLVELHIRFGKAFVSMAQWSDAEREFEAALNGLGPGQSDRRIGVLEDLLGASWWAMDLATVGRRGAELRALGDQLDRPDLQVTALSWLAPTAAAEGDLVRSIAMGEGSLAQGHALGVEPPPMMQAFLPITYYWVGRIEEAVERSRESVLVARHANHASATMNALPNLGVSLAASGRYTEAISVFEDARRFGSAYGVGTLLARAIAMSAGFHLDLFDYTANEAIAEEARELARRLNWNPTLISAGLDLILNFARRQEVARAEKLVAEVADVAAQATAWHGWLWGLRLAEARAELALSRGNWDAAVDLSTQAIELCRLRRRVKYEVLGLTTRSQALVRLRRLHEACDDQQRAVQLARATGDPALLVRSASGLVSMTDDEAVAVEVYGAVQRIVADLADDRLRRTFESAECVRAVPKM